MISVEKLITGLTAISEDAFTCDNVYEYLGANPVDVGTITKYFH